MKTNDSFDAWFFDACNFDKDSSQYYWAKQAYQEGRRLAFQQAAQEADHWAIHAAYKYAGGYAIDFEKEVGDRIRSLK